MVLGAVTARSSLVSCSQTSRIHGRVEHQHLQVSRTRGRLELQPLLGSCVPLFPLAMSEYLEMAWLFLHFSQVALLAPRELLLS